MSPQELVFSFPSRQAAWSFSRAAEKAGYLAGFPSLGSPWKVRALPLSTPPGTLDREAASVGGSREPCDLVFLSDRYRRSDGSLPCDIAEQSEWESRMERRRRLEEQRTRRFTDSDRMEWYATPSERRRGSLETGDAAVRKIDENNCTYWRPLGKLS